MEKEPEIAGRAMAVRGAGQRIVELIGKRAVHPVSMGIGRFTEEPTAETLLEVRQIARELKSLARDLIERVESSEFSGKTIPFPDNHGVHFLCYEEGEEGGVFAIYDRSGVLVDTFAREDFEQNIAEMRAGWSFAKFPYLTRLGFPDGILLVGPLSRLFRPGGLLEDGEVGSLPLADRLRDPRVLSLGDYDLCRLLEIYWAAIRVERLMEEVDLDEKTPAVDREQSGLGIGVVEAPRGVLVHNYLIKNGCIEKIRLLVATQFNNPFINLMIGEIASANVRDGVLSEEGEKLVGHCIRVFDPCLSCATH
jgi:NAD-reducing hydrogenase large subunit